MKNLFAVGAVAAAISGMGGWAWGDSMIDALPNDTFTTINTATISPTLAGQTFTTGADRFLTSFEFYGFSNRNGEAGTFHIAPWTGTTAGASLFSAPFVGTTLTQPLIFNTGFLQLNPNASYLAYIEEHFTVPTQVNFVRIDQLQGYAGGDPEIGEDGVSWENLSKAFGFEVDYAFKAQFATALPAPLPPAVFMGAGLLGLMGAVRLLGRMRARSS